VRAAQDPRPLRLQRHPHRESAASDMTRCFFSALLAVCLGLFRI
jgi:hypothetical protein